MSKPMGSCNGWETPIIQCTVNKLFATEMPGNSACFVMCWMKDGYSLEGGAAQPGRLHAAVKATSRPMRPNNNM